jgi:hypothetical protein
MGLTYKLEGKKDLAEKNLRLARQLAVQQQNKESLDEIDQALKDLGVAPEKPVGG